MSRRIATPAGLVWRTVDDVRPRKSFDRARDESGLKFLPELTWFGHHNDVFGNCVGTARFGAKAAELTHERIIKLERTPNLSFDPC